MTPSDLRHLVRAIPDFPKPGILFRDITPLLADGKALRAVTDLLVEAVAGWGTTRVVGIESRGFLFGTLVAERLGVGFAPVRKPGKLPWKTRREAYALEYGEDALEMHEDAVAGQRVLIVDDLLATGGTAAAAARLAKACGAEVAGFAFVIELAALGGRQALGTDRAGALLTY